MRSFTTITEWVLQTFVKLALLTMFQYSRLAGVYHDKADVDVLWLITYYCHPSFKFVSKFVVIYVRIQW